MVSSIKDIIMLFVAYGLVLTIFILEIINVIKKRPITISKVTAFLLIMSLVFATFLTFQGKELTSADWAQLLPMLGLFIVTTFYAMSADRQAKASVEMAEEMKKQRYTESLPLLVPDITRRSIVDKKLESNEVDYGTLQTGVGLEVTWHNLGKGVAINTRLSFSSPPLDSHPGKSFYFPPRESKALGVAAKESISFKWEQFVGQLVDQTKPRLEAEYRDIYERKITTVQEFRIDEQKGNKRAFLGELYFTINGRRLGEEVTQHD